VIQRLSGSLSENASQEHAPEPAGTVDDGYVERLLEISLQRFDSHESEANH
jgi:hypothetical protein